jgi:effector-binding domain-containing protein
MDDRSELLAARSRNRAASAGNPARLLDPRVMPLTAPAVELAVITHHGSHHDVDRAYGTLGAYVAEHALGVEGPLREFYVVGLHETADQTRWQTEIGWPIFHTGPDH